MRSGWHRVAARRCKPLHSKTDCRTLRCEGEFCTPQPKILARRGRRIPTTSSFLPATLRLTGGTDDVSRALRDVAARCRIAWLHQQNQHLFDFRSVPPFADLCRCLFGASKGARKGQHTLYTALGPIDRISNDVSCTVQSVRPVRARSGVTPQSRLFPRCPRPAR